MALESRATRALRASQSWHWSCENLSSKRRLPWKSLLWSDPDSEPTCLGKEFVLELARLFSVRWPPSDHPLLPRVGGGTVGCEGAALHHCIPNAQPGGMNVGTWWQDEGNLWPSTSSCKNLTGISSRWEGLLMFQPLTSSWISCRLLSFMSYVHSCFGLLRCLPQDQQRLLEVGVVFFAVELPVQNRQRMGFDTQYTSLPSWRALYSEHGAHWAMGGHSGLGQQEAPTFLIEDFMGPPPPS